MARILIVGCGCRGAALTRRLIADGHTVRGTTRDASHVTMIEAAGAEAAIADPARLGSLLPCLDSVAVIYWLMGTATGDPDVVAALHNARLEAILSRIVDTAVRGFAYEAAGSVDDGLLDGGAQLVRAAERRWHIPCELIATHPDAHDAWVDTAAAAADRLLRD